MAAAGLHVPEAAVDTVLDFDEVVMAAGFLHRAGFEHREVSRYLQERGSGLSPPFSSTGLGTGRSAVVSVSPTSDWREGVFLRRAAQVELWRTRSAPDSRGAGRWIAIDPPEFLDSVGNRT